VNSIRDGYIYLNLLKSQKRLFDLEFITYISTTLSCDTVLNSICSQLKNFLFLKKQKERLLYSTLTRTTVRYSTHRFLAIYSMRSTLYCRTAKTVLTHFHSIPTLCVLICYFSGDIFIPQSGRTLLVLVCSSRQLRTRYTATPWNVPLFFLSLSLSQIYLDLSLQASALFIEVARSLSSERCAADTAAREFSSLSKKIFHIFYA